MTEETAAEKLRRERNMFKGKYRAMLKLVHRTRNKIVQITDHIQDEGDRAYFGSTNHADELKEIYHDMMSWLWDAEDETNRMKSDPYADIRKQRARAVKAEAEAEALRAAIAKALDPTSHGIGGIETSEDAVAYMAGVLLPAIGIKSEPQS